MSKKYSKIDFHVHYLTNIYKDVLYKNYGSKPEGFQTPEWDISKQREIMEQNNIKHALLGISSPYFCGGDKEETVLSVFKNNCEIAELLAIEHTMDFMAALPLPYIDETMYEIEHALSLGAKGFSVNTHAKEVYLGNPKLDLIMEKLNAHKSIVAIHPTMATSVPKEVCEGLPIPAIEFFFDTTRTFINLSINQVFERFPDIQWIFPHAGAFIPFASDRIQVFIKRMNSKYDIFKDIKHVYFDLAGYVEPQMLDAILKVTTTERLLYGSDWPHTPILAADKNCKILEETNKLSSQDKEKVFYENGKKLLDLASQRYAF